MAGNLRCLRVELGKAPVEVTIPNHLESLQKEVGGYIQLVRFDTVSAIVNDDGAPMRLLPNSCGFLGNYLLVATTTRRGEFRSMTDAEVQAAHQWWQHNRAVVWPEMAA